MPWTSEATSAHPSHGRDGRWGRRSIRIRRAAAGTRTTKPLSLQKILTSPSKLYVRKGNRVHTVPSYTDSKMRLNGVT